MQTNHLPLEQAVEWRAAVWAPAVQSALERAKQKLNKKPESILEIGFFSGLMSCYLAQEFQTQVISYDISEEQKKIAQNNAQKFGQDQRIDFRVIDPQQTTSITGQFDLIFLKSVLYHHTQIEDYLSWLRWLKSCLAPGGVLVAVENGQGHFLDRLYRSRLDWGQNLLFNRDRLEDFKEHFSQVEIEYFGGISQYLTSLPVLSHFIGYCERKFYPHHSDNSFIASIIAQA